MGLTIRVSRRADREIDHAANWYAKHAVQLGQRWVKGIRKAIDSLAENPDRCGLAHESDDFEFELRELYFGVGRKKTHRILFRITEDIVEILAVRHFAQQDVTPDDL